MIITDCFISLSCYLNIVDDSCPKLGSQKTLVIKMKNVLIIGLLIYNLDITVFGAKILLLPGDHPAHVNLFCVVGKTLSNKGHEVHMVSVEKHRDKITQAKINPILHKPIKAISVGDDPVLIERQSEIFFGGITPFTLVEFIRNVTQRMRNQTEEILQNVEIQRKLKQTQFNLAIVDGSFPARPIYAVVYKYGIPYVSLTTSFSEPWAARVPSMPSVEPIPLLQFSNQMTFFQRLANFFFITAFVNLKWIPGLLLDDIISECVPEKPYITLDELHSKSEMFFTNMDLFLMDYPRVSAPHFIYITGTGGSKPLPLNDDLNEFITTAENGVIVVSFGSFIKKMPLYIAKKLFDVFSNLSEVKFVLRFSDELPFAVPPNVKIMKWIPQNDLLGHPKTKLFFTHGGTNGMMEAIFHGVPMLVAPLGGDHPYNAIKMELKSYGRTVNIIKDNPAYITKVLKDVLENSTYYESIRKAKQILKHLPKGDETVAYWVEHILKFGNDHILPAYRDMPLYQLFMLDVLLFLVVMVLFTSWIICKMCRFCVRTCCKQPHKVKSE